MRMVLAVILGMTTVVLGCSSRDQPSADFKPLRSGGSFLCPAGTVPAYRSDKHFYPSGYPAAPPAAVRPSGCFTSAISARKAGYTMAATPVGSQLIDGVYLVPAPPGLSTDCHNAASLLGFAVPCPGLLPSSGLATVTSPCAPTSTHGCVNGRVFELSPADFVVPSNYQGVDGRPEGHLYIVGAREGDVSEELDCPGGTSSGSVTVRGIAAAMVVCPQSSTTHGGHVLLRWNEERVVIVVSLHGNSLVNRKLVVAIASALRLVV